MSEPTDDMTDDEVNQHLANRGYIDSDFEGGMTKIKNALSEKVLRDRIEEIGKQFGFDFYGKKCPKCGGPMMHTRLNGYVCMGRCQ